jgi:hypothetical protein
VIFNGSGFLLFWPAVDSFLSAIVIIARPAGKTTIPLAAASAFFGLAIALYQLAASVGLSGSPLAGIANYSIAVFAGFIVLYLILLYLTLRSPKSAGS